MNMRNCCVYLRSLAAVFTAVVALEIGCVPAYGAARLEEEKNAAEELKQVLGISDEKQGTLNVIRYEEEEEAYHELLEALKAVSEKGTDSLGKETSKENADTALEPLFIKPAEINSSEMSASEQARENHDSIYNLPEYTETYYLDLDEEDGFIRLRADDLRKIFPNMMSWSGSWARGVSSFDYKLRTSLVYAKDIISDATGKEDGGNRTSFKADEEIFTIIMVQDMNLHLCGFGCWHPKKIGDKKWQIMLAKCDYDYSDLYEKDHEGFRETDNWKWIEPNAEIIAECGAEYYTMGYNDTSEKRKESNLKRQLFLIWLRGKEDSLTPIQKLPDDAEEYLSNKRTQSRYYAFYDKNREIIGYTDIIGSSLDIDKLRELLENRK